MNALGDHYLAGAAADDVDQTLGFAQMLGAAGDVHGHGLVLRLEVQAVEQLLADELHRIEQLQSWVQAILQ
ncbi:hypothetical protein D3C80_2153790 [compost metagenome]